MKMQNLSGLTPRNREVIIIGDGPSKKLIMNQPEIAENCSVCLMNGVMAQWPHAADYLITYHGEFVQRYWEARLEKGYLMNDMVAMATLSSHRRVVIPKSIPWIEIPQGKYGVGGGGTSSHLAATVLRSMGYWKIHMYGVDLNTSGYMCDRKYWVTLKDEPIVSHGIPWFQERRFEDPVEEERWQGQL